MGEGSSERTTAIACASCVILCSAVLLDYARSSRNSKVASRPREREGEASVPPLPTIKWNANSRSFCQRGALGCVCSQKSLSIRVIQGIFQKSTPFVPKNPLVSKIQGIFLDEDTADIFFTLPSPNPEFQDILEVFPAHLFVLKACAPMLADLYYGSGEFFALPGVGGNLNDYTVIEVTDVEPHIFRHLLFYVYGGSVPEEELKTYAKDIIDAADKYAIINLKLEAEAAYVESAGITMENAVDNLLYADAKNCALLKEAVLDFLAENSVEAAQNISFTDVPGHVINDLLVAFGRSKNNDGSENDADKYSTMRVSELRFMLDEKGLDVDVDVDGPREAMIEALRANS
ncbi:hypothetical protein ACHAWC_005109 [Mediolabrus comicus]